MKKKIGAALGAAVLIGTSFVFNTTSVEAQQTIYCPEGDNYTCYTQGAWPNQYVVKKGPGQVIIITKK